MPPATSRIGWICPSASASFTSAFCFFWPRTLWLAAALFAWSRKERIRSCAWARVSLPAHPASPASARAADRRVRTLRARSVVSRAWRST